MKENQIKAGFRLVNEGLLYGEMPQRSTTHSAGYDLKAIHDAAILPGEISLVKTGLSVYMPPDHELQIRPRSGMALKYGITVLNSPGTIDADFEYPNEIGVILINHSDKPYVIHRGDKICQAVFSRYYITEYDNAEGTRESGFGSTGV